ncbi:hypothetical protein [Jatrophihabitans sp.]|uniref:hypothetical protein n=1 Tax=Jatrophihabitans sp. TaxID=1932789 RepID=UPI0030C77C79|nr:hypothetical protein [Jatrophihabitans sp.]
MPTFSPDCTSCGLPIEGRVIHDQGKPWCEFCLKLRIESKAAANADRYIAADPDAARELCLLQRPKVAA